MDAVEEKTGGAAVKGPGPHGAYDEGGAGVVAEGQQPLTLLCGYGPAALHVGNVGGTQRVAPGEADKEGGGPGSGDAVDTGGSAGQEPSKKAGETQAVEKSREDEKGKERGQYQLHTQVQGVAAAIYDLGGSQSQSSKAADADEQGQTIFHKGTPPCPCIKL